LVATDLANTLKKAAYVSQARDEVAFLQQKIAANSSISPGEKSTLIATTNKVSDQLSSVQSIIDQTIGALNAYRSRQASQESFFGMITAANAQGNGSSLYIDKSLFAAAAFVVLVIVLGYCLWIIGQKGTSQADKKWAKDLLTSQITFLAGVIGGIILK
jgi:hypothetical protein